MRFKNFTLDKFQEDAVHAIEKNHSVLVHAPTGSGKTLIADYIIDRDIKEGKKVIYTAPIKALSNQKYRDFIADYGEDKIGLLTGDVVINPGAQVLIMTTEIYRNMAISKDFFLHDVTYCIFDEVHFISDEERGYIWEESIIFSPENIRFVFLSATIPNAKQFASWVGKIKNHYVQIVRHTTRPVPLEMKFFDTELGITTLNEIKERKELDNYPDYKGLRRKKYRTRRMPPPSFMDVVNDLKQLDKLPCIYFVFSRAKTQEYAVNLVKQFLNEKEKEKITGVISKEFRSISPEVMQLRSTKALRQCLSKGVAFHHAGMLPDVKHIVEKLFGMGLVKVLFATETFAVGINMPARTVCFDSLRKFTGTGFRYVNSKEFFQISGRAGRRGIDKKGLVVSLIHRTLDDLKRIEVFTAKDTLPLRSQFKISYNTVLNMIHLHSEEEINQILAMNFLTFQEPKGLRSIKARYGNLVRFLKRLGYVEDGKLTDLGLFTTKIYSNEIEISQIFMGDFKLDEYMILLVVGALMYEEKRGVKVFKSYPSEKITKVMMQLRSHPVLKKGDWYKNMEMLSGLIHPLYDQKKFVEILKDTNMPEGDLIRFYMRIMDSLEQISQSTRDDRKAQLVRNAKWLIRNSLEGIHVF